MKRKFNPVDPTVSFPALEDDIARQWKERGIVEKTLASGDRLRPFVFFEGPPTANGRPGVHHVESRATKDAIVRYRRMRGHRVIGARGGWDAHGLPVEIEVEKALGFEGKGDIERHGIAEFNEACRASVWQYIQEWERMTDRIAFWIDLRDPYVTYHNEYIESLWWILKTLWDKDFLFRDYKVTMHCPRCGTSLADHEVSLGFQDDVDDPSVWVRFPYQASGHALDTHLATASFLAWTTTPWTLPANAALAVNPDATYVLVEYVGGKDPERLILAEALAGSVLIEGTFTTLASYTGDELRGVCYQPPFAGVPAEGDVVDWALAHRVVADDFVSLAEGTGIVHVAPAYGDLDLGRKHGLPVLFSVDLAGRTLAEFGELGFGGIFFKEADPLIGRNLRERGLLFRSGRVLHSYPFCWRCKTPLLYYAKPSWYIRTTAKKEQLLANNETIRWVPGHIQHGRFGEWLKGNVDWALSRERYWGTPLPIWICDACERVAVIGSVAELSERAGRDLADLDLHRPFVDEVTWTCETCNSGRVRRVPDVADCWFDSGAMPVAQWHYPFENQDLFPAVGQADYIAEAIDQTRGWFYTLHALSTLLFDRPAFKNVICLGHILDINGEKMSKARGNVVDPWIPLERDGADATRWYMFASAPPYNPRRFAPEQVTDVVRQFLLTLWNTYAFFVRYANQAGWTPVALEGPAVEVDLQPSDRWVLARLNGMVRDVTAMLDEYDVHGPVKEIERFVDELSNWYVRRNRRRFWKAQGDNQGRAAYQTLHTCLATLTRLLAPFAPFVSEALYRNLVTTHDPDAPESVHLAAWPATDPQLIDDGLIAETAVLLQAIGLGRAARQRAGLRVRQPLSELLVRPPRGSKELHCFAEELREELNVRSVRFLGVSDEMLEYRLRPNLPAIGKKQGRLVPMITAALEHFTIEEAMAAARAIESGQPLEVRVDGQPIILEPNEVLLDATSPAGFAVAADSTGLLVALNTVVTPELRDEGWARDLVRFTQDARKAAGFAITDRIRATLQPADGLDLARVLRSYGDVIRNEILADRLTLGSPEENAHVSKVELDGESLLIGVRRVAGRSVVAKSAGEGEG